MNVFARAWGCYELSRSSMGDEPVDLAMCGIDVAWIDGQLTGLVRREWVLRGNCGCDVYWKLDGEEHWHAATRRRTLLGDAAYFHYLRRYQVVRVQVRFAVRCASLAEASALLATAARLTVADYQDALAECHQQRQARQLGLQRGVADLWNVAEVVEASEPLIDMAAGLIVAGAVDVCDLDLDEAVARSGVLVEVVARTLSVDAADVTVEVLDAANDEDSTALGDAPRVTDLLRTIPMAGGTNALDATSTLLDEYFAAQAPAPAEEDDATMAPGLLHGESVYLGRGGDNTVKSRCEAIVLRLGGAVVERSESPSLQIVSDNHDARCDNRLKHLLPTRRIVRERWLRRVERLAPGAELPDFKPDAVYAQAHDLMNRASYWYDEEYTHGGGLFTAWARVRADWTSAQAGGAG